MGSTPARGVMRNCNQIPLLGANEEHSLTRVFAGITDDQWHLAVPKSLQKEEVTLKKLMNSHAYDDAWVPETLAGKTSAEVGTQYDGDLLGDNPQRNWERIVAKAVAAVEALSIVDMEKTTHLSYGDFPVNDYLWHITLFRTFRTVDIARFLHVDASLPEDLVRGVWEVVEPQAPRLRKMGVFGSEVEVAKDAPLYERLLGLSGRHPT
jgi:uncharacterized protein (TIGR03086 family)